MKSSGQKKPNILFRKKCKASKSRCNTWVLENSLLRPCSLWDEHSDLVHKQSLKLLGWIRFSLSDVLTQRLLNLKIILNIIVRWLPLLPLFKVKYKGNLIRTLLLPVYKNKKTISHNWMNKPHPGVPIYCKPHECCCPPFHRFIIS